MSKKIFAFLIGFYLSNASANPVIYRPMIISEFCFDSTGWIIEVQYDFIFDDVDEYPIGQFFIQSSTDTAYFRPDLRISGDRGRHIIRADSLTSPLAINPERDTINFSHDNMPYGYVGYLCSFNFSNQPNESGGCRLWLRPGQSLLYVACAYCLNNSPILGDTSATPANMGKIDGRVRDAIAQPVKNLTVYISPNEADFPFGENLAKTDSIGHFTADTWATCNTLFFPTPTGDDKIIRRQVYPDSTIYVDVSLDFVNDVEQHKKLIVNDYRIENIYPNPFNNSTAIYYTLPIDDYIDIDIFNVHGEFVASLVSAFQTAGEHVAFWQAELAPSGLYMARLKSAQALDVRKIALIK